MNDEFAHKSKTAQTCDSLRDAIVQAKFLPGEKLPIDHLCEAFEASSGAVREALSRLTAEGLVRAEPQKGFMVAPISRSDLIDLTEARVSIETHCLEQAITHGDVEWETRVLSARHRLNALVYARLDAAGKEQWHGLHLQFHTALVSACPNQCWLHLRQMLFTQSERYRRLSVPVEKSDRSVEVEHNQIADATLARDVKGACKAMKQHLEKTTEILLNSKLPFLEPQNGRKGSPTPVERTAARSNNKTSAKAPVSRAKKARSS